VTVFRRPDSSRAYVRLVFREPVHLVREGLGPHGFWCEVETDDGARGFVACSAISNVWLLVSKPDRRLYVHRGPERVATLVADVGYNAFADKEQRGSRRERDHWRTPEGTFYVVKKNPASQFHKAFLLNYPQPDDARRGLGRGLITQAEHDAIMEAARTHRPPPMDTPLGGWIEIHGDGTGAATNWTEGCIAIPNDDMDWLWRLVHRGTPVVVE
jgi:lipoprotein-anchoring transpeptidase ErfK/SrfK